jgi:hypothetical protein
MLPLLLGITVGTRSPLFILSVVVAVFVFWTHRANIVRLRNGEEHRFGKKGAAGKMSVGTVAIAVVIVLSVLAAARFA